MIKLKLIKGLSYRGGRDGSLKATKDKPFCYVETMEEAQEAIASGHFQMVEGEQAIPGKPVNDIPPAKAVDDMTKDELLAYAKEKGIDLSECKNNDERKETIKKALEGESTKVPFEEE